MKNTVIFLFIFSLYINAFAQSPIGAWKAFHVNKEGDSVQSVVTFADGYQSLVEYIANTGEFISTNGGIWQLEGDTMTEKVEFHTLDSTMVGKEFSFKVIMTDSTLTVEDSDKVFHRIDDGSPGSLNGAWLMSGRVRNGEMSSRDTNRPRKTMKILSGTRFQWIAYNTETKQFMGTGGGTYTTENGNYVENIEFFSRDDSRVGASLEFQFTMEDGNWHHKGFSSKGDPLHEVWSLRDK